MEMCFQQNITCTQSVLWTKTQCGMSRKHSLHPDGPAQVFHTTCHAPGSIHCIGYSGEERKRKGEMERGEMERWIEKGSGRREERVFGGERWGCLVESREGVWWREVRVFVGERWGCLLERGEGVWWRENPTPRVVQQRVEVRGDDEIPCSVYTTCDAVWSSAPVHPTCSYVHVHTKNRNQ